MTAPDPHPLLRHRVNPCDIDRHPALAALGDALAALYALFTRGTTCPCCLGTRLAATIAIAFTTGYLL